LMSIVAIGEDALRRWVTALKRRCGGMASLGLTTYVGLNRIDFPFGHIVMPLHHQAPIGRIVSRRPSSFDASCPPAWR
jgi:hypothetical protein